MKVIRTMEHIKEYFSGQNTAVALGAFDGLHIGHRAVIRPAVESGLRSVVFTFKDNPAALLGGRVRYLTTVEERLRILESWGVDTVVLPDFSEVAGLSAQAFLELLFTEISAQKLFCGTDFTFGCGAAGNTETLQAACRARGAELHVIPAVTLRGERVSATRIRNALERGDAEEAAALLGRPFGFELEVVHGNRLGRTIGIPTVNQPLPADFVLPRFGVYASAVRIGDTEYLGVTNVGVKPTVGSDRVLAETWIPDFAGDLYGRTLRLELLGFIRDERKFASLEELREVIADNAVTARAIYERHKSTL